MLEVRLMELHRKTLSQNESSPLILRFCPSFLLVSILLFLSHGPLCPPVISVLNYAQMIVRGAEVGGVVH